MLLCLEGGTLQAELSENGVTRRSCGKALPGSSEEHPQDHCGPQGGSQLWALFLGFRDFSWPSQALHPNPANFLARALGCGGMEGLLTTRAGALSSEGKGEAHQSERRERDGVKPRLERL